MTDRTVKTTLTVNVQGYLQGMDQASRKTREVGSEADKLAQKRQAFQTLGVSALALGTAIAFGLGLAIAKSAEFDQAMSNANAILQETTANQGLLRDAALEAGGATVFTATESANAIEELGKAGVATADILSGGLSGSLDLAASAQLGVARAAEITGITLKQFNLDGTQAARVADVLSAGANKAVGSVDDLANGLKFVAPVAKGMNVSLEDTVATLTLFADRGVIGEQAGTSLRGMLSSLTSPSKQAKKELDALGVSLYDGQGRFKGLENVAGELNRALHGTDDATRDMALGTIFGNQQITAARILVDAGAETWRDYRAAVDDTGIASRIAAARMDNLAGDIEKLGGAFDTALIQTGSGANDVLRGIVQAVTALVDWVGALPEPVLAGGLAVAGLGAAVLIATGITFTAIPKWQAFKASIDALGISAGATALKAGLIGIAVAGVAAVLTIMATQAANARAKVEAYADTLEDGTNRVTKATRELVKQNLSDVPDFWARLSSTSRIESVYDSAEKLGLSLDTVTDAAAGSADALGELSPYLKRIAEDNEFAESEAKRLGISFQDLTNAADNTARGIRGESESLDEAIRVAKQKQRVDKDSTDTTLTAADAYQAANKQVTDLNDSLQGLLDTLNEANGTNQDAISANLDYLNTLADVDEAIQKAREGQEGYALTLDDSTQSGRDNLDMLVGLAGKAWDAAEAQFQLDGNTQNFQASLVASRDALIKRAEDLGYTRDQAVDLADKILAIPTESEWKMIADTSAATQTIDTFVRTYDGKSITLKLNADQVVVGDKIYSGLRSNYMGGMYSGGVKTFAQGGFESGIYGYTPGGIHKFAEAGDEAYMSFLPQYRQRNIGIWQESGERLGVWRQAVPYGGAAAGASSVDQSVHVAAVVKSDDPYVAAELVGQRIGSLLAVRG